MNPEVKKLEGHEVEQFKDLILLFEDVFEMDRVDMPENTYLQQLLEKDSFHVFIALEDKQVVGGLTAYTIPGYYAKASQVYIYDLAVKTDRQRRGIGKKLMAAILDYCKGIGMGDVFVQAEQEDAHAVAFYHATGGEALDAVHFSYKLQS